MRFNWDQANTKHLARHGITREEAEEALANDPLVVQLQEHTAEQRVLCLGRTDRGRLLAVVYTEREGAIRVVTAYPMTRRQEAIYPKER